jgi:hypothetical protein
MSSLVFPLDTHAPAVWHSPDGSAAGSFRPQGKPCFAYPSGPSVFNTLSGFRAGARQGGPVRCGRMFLGVDDGRAGERTVRKVVNVCKAVRRKQIGAPDRRIVLFHGAYHSALPADESRTRGIQLLIFDLHKPASARSFEKQIVELADKIMKQLGREVIVAELLEDGVRVRTIGISP